MMTIGPVLLPILWTAGTMAVNTVRMRSWANEFFAVTPPSGALVVETGSDFGHLVGNGNHCDRRAWVTLDTEAAPASIAQHYDPYFQSTEHVFAGGQITVEQLEGDFLRVERFETFPAGWDPRCH